MLKHFAIWSTLVIIGTGSAHAQQREAVLQKIEVPGADFHIVVATGKSDGTTIDLRGQPDPLVVYLMGTEFVHAYDDEMQRMFPGFYSIKSPSCAFNVQHREDRQPNPVAVYIVPNGEPALSSQK